MANSNLLPFLRSLGRQLNAEYDSINYGGCCVVAGYLALLLRHYAKVGVVVEKDYGFGQVQSLDAIRSNTANNLDPEEWHSNGVGFYHVLVKFELDGYSYTVDSDNVTLLDEDTERKLYPGELTIEEAIAFGKADTWNDEFDRDQIPGIKRTLTQAFRAYRNQQGVVCYE